VVSLSAESVQFSVLAVAESAYRFRIERKLLVPRAGADIDRVELYLAERNEVRSRARLRVEGRDSSVVFHVGAKAVA
jgi:hypothetical protein